MFRNRSFGLQIRIPWVNPVLGTKFPESRSKTGIIRKEMSIFLNHPVCISLDMSISTHNFLTQRHSAAHQEDNTDIANYNE